MLKDITLGQFFPGNTLVHRIDPRFKLLMIFAFMISLFMMKGAVSLTIMSVFVFVSVIASKIGIKMIFKNLKPLMFLILFTVCLNMFFTPGETLWQLGFVRITREGVEFSVLMAVRIILLIVGTSLLTYTTSPIRLTDAIEQLLSPLKRLKIPVGELAMMMTIALRFIPTLLNETDRIMSSQKARGADFESGGVIKRIKAFVPVLVPVFVSAFKRADELALAMESRCYRDGTGRTRLNQLKSNRFDWVILAVSVVFFSSAAVLGVLGY